MVKNLHLKEYKIKSTWEHMCSIKGAAEFCLLHLKHLKLFIESQQTPLETLASDSERADY